MCDLIPTNQDGPTHYYLYPVKGRGSRVAAHPSPQTTRDSQMKYWMLAVTILILAMPDVGSAESNVRKGQRLFAGCVKKVDDKETLKTGQFVCKGKRDPAPFGGNGRACGDCHMPGDNFGISVDRIAGLSSDHPFFFRGLDENQKLLRDQGLVHVIVPGQIDEFRQTPKLVHLQEVCDKRGNCDSLGLLGDRVTNLCALSIQAISNHMSKSTRRIVGKDFRVPTEKECKWLVAYMLSDLVADQDERNK